MHERTHSWRTPPTPWFWVCFPKVPIPGGWWMRWKLENRWEWWMESIGHHESRNSRTRVRVGSVAPRKKKNVSNKISRHCLPQRVIAVHEFWFVFLSITLSTFQQVCRTELFRLKQLTPEEVVLKSPPGELGHHFIFVFCSISRMRRNSVGFAQHQMNKLSIVQRLSSRAMQLHFKHRNLVRIFSLFIHTHTQTVVVVHWIAWRHPTPGNHTIIKWKSRNTHFHSTDSLRFFSVAVQFPHNWRRKLVRLQNRIVFIR